MSPELRYEASSTTFNINTFIVSKDPRKAMESMHCEAKDKGRELYVLNKERGFPVQGTGEVLVADHKASSRPPVRRVSVPPPRIRVTPHRSRSQSLLRKIAAPPASAAKSSRNRAIQRFRSDRDWLDQSRAGGEAKHRFEASASDPIGKPVTTMYESSSTLSISNEQPSFVQWVPDASFIPKHQKSKGSGSSQSNRGFATHSTRLTPLSSESEVGRGDNYMLRDLHRGRAQPEASNARRVPVEDLARKTWGSSDDALVDQDTQSDPQRAGLDTSRRSSTFESEKGNKKKKDFKTPEGYVRKLNADSLQFSSFKMKGQPPIPRLAHGLDRVLFNPGVYHVQDPRSRVYNFDPYVENITPVSEFDFDALTGFITSSEDKQLAALAKRHKKRYVGSSSSLTGVLSVFHHLLSQWRPLNIQNISRSFPDENLNFTRISRGPAAVHLRWRDGSYAIDADKTFDSETVLSALGQSMEKFLTHSSEDFQRFRKSQAAPTTPAEVPEANSYHYSALGDIMVRSQLDAQDSRLPGTGVFDLKTRAALTVRMDVKNYEEMRGYEIRHRFGLYESFEREYYDMIRAAFLKYSLQVRLGRMDGIFVAFHNTTRVFGFQYIPLEEMDLAIHGQPDPSLGNKELALSMEILNDVLDQATKRFPKQVSCPSELPVTRLIFCRVSQCTLRRAPALSSPSCISLSNPWGRKTLSLKTSRLQGLRSQRHPRL